MSVESANESVATVSIAENVITVSVVAPGTTKGTVIITDADSQEVLTKDFNITCQDVVDSITFDNETPIGGRLVIPWGSETGTLGVTIVKHDDYTVSVSSADETVATVAYNNGVITATRYGVSETIQSTEGTIAIMNGDEVVISRNFYIVCLGKPNIYIENDSVTIDSTGGTAQFIALDIPESATIAFTAVSDDDSVVTTGTLYFESGYWNVPLIYQGAGSATVTISMLADNVAVATGTISVTAT